MSKQEQMKRGKRRDEIGRLDHARACDERPKAKKQWLSELEVDRDDELTEYEELALDYLEDRM